MDEVSPEIRERIEERYGDGRWKIYVCAEIDGEECVPCSVNALVNHSCAAWERFRTTGANGPETVWIEVAPAPQKKE